jgi:hypothetical protein
VSVLRWMLLGALLLAGCSDELGRFPSGPEPTPVPIPADTLAMLHSGALAADTVVQLARQVVVIPFPGGSVTIGYENGFYEVDVVMFGSHRRLRLQFQDAAGRPMPLYDPVRTRAIRVMTLSEDFTGLRRFDVTVRGVEAGSDEFRIDGNGRVQQRDSVWLFFANRLVLAKVGNPYPLRGEVVLETPHEAGERSSVSLRFNGSQVVDGVLESGSVSVYFTLDLISLEITPREPVP